MRKGERLTDEQKIELGLKITELYGEGDLTLAQCCKKFGVGSDRTFYRWVNNIAEIADAYAHVKNTLDREYNIRVALKARTELERRLDGYTKVLEERFYESATGDDNELTLKNVKVKQVHIVASDALLEKVLLNRDPENWKDIKNLQVTGADGASLFEGIQIYHQPPELEPVTDEETAEKMGEFISAPDSDISMESEQPETD